VITPIAIASVSVDLTVNCSAPLVFEKVIITREYHAMKFARYHFHAWFVLESLISDFDVVDTWTIPR
jgi:hypothetical protein